MDGGNSKLATLISQAGGDFDFRGDLKDQLQLWREQRIDAHIDENIRKIYALLAGIIDEVVEGSKGSGLEMCGDIDVAQGLDWKRTFGLNLWYSEPIDASIAQVFQAYSRLMKDSSPGRIIAGPVPWYQEQTTSISSRWKISSIPPPDALFSLIRLHAEPACSLSQILTPLSFGMSPIDYVLPWHLYTILSRCMRVRDFADRGDPGMRRRGSANLDADGSDSESGIEGHSPSADLLTSSYAFQLERSGMIQEALFVLLHIEGSAGCVICFGFRARTPCELFDQEGEDD
jgi:nuclear pore complex protein Nup98-Nup96